LLTRCIVCGAAKHVHENKDHEFELDTAVPQFKGWHAFRRSLATNLYVLDVKPRFIQAILRHSDIAVTMGYYVESSEEETRAALNKLQDLLRND
jgi:integrase